MAADMGGKWRDVLTCGAAVPFGMPRAPVATAIARHPTLPSPVRPIAPQARGAM